MGWTKWRGNTAKKLTRRATHNGLMRAGEATLGVSNQQVPLDQDTLLTSGRVIPNPANDLEIAISYGGGPGTGFPRVPYAVKWHETPANFQHGRKTDYLRDPFNTFTPGAVKQELTKELKKVW